MHFQYNFANCLTHPFFFWYIFCFTYFLWRCEFMSFSPWTMQCLALLPELRYFTLDSNFVSECSFETNLQGFFFFFFNEWTPSPIVFKLLDKCTLCVLYYIRCSILLHILFLTFHTIWRKNHFIHHNKSTKQSVPTKYAYKYSKYLIRCT